MKGDSRTIEVGYVARVEGEAAILIRVEGGRVVDAKFSIFEPPRLFEALLCGRSYAEAPDITSRICGICPVAYLTSACLAMESALGIELAPRLRRLRRLLYCGEWMESHGLHVFLLHAPDFLGYPDAMAMAKDHRAIVEKGLAIKKAGNALVALLGGRSIHPVSVRVGGFFRAPSKDELTTLLPGLVRARDDTREALRWAASLPFPALERDYEFVALRHPDEYAIAYGRIASSKGLDIAVPEYGEHFVEEQVSWSNAKRSRRRGGGSYVCGPLARFNLSFERLRPEVREAARAIGFVPPVRNPYKSLLARLVEILEAATDAIEIIETWERPEPPYVPTAGPLGPTTGFGASEAPRGLLYHRYSLDAEGTIVDAEIVPPTSQNQRVMEEELFDAAPALAELTDAEATARAEHLVRNHDPCISCATHFLRVKIERA